MWKKLKVVESQLNLRNTLLNGQCFGWQESEGIFTGVIQQAQVRMRRVSPQIIQYITTPQCQIDKNLHELFNLDQKVTDLYSEWNKSIHFQKAGNQYPGVRCMRQDPWQCTISFICSSNNNISRITKLVQSLRIKYGRQIQNTNSFTFPKLFQLQRATKQQLKQLGFGYRASFIVDSVKHIQGKGIKWLKGLRGQPHSHVRKQLMNMNGIGRKVADCISLFSMDCSQAIPVDTHVYQIAARMGLIKQGKSLSDRVYEQIGKGFERAFGEKCGWAHQILFLGDLKKERKNESTVKKQKK